MQDNKNFFGDDEIHRDSIETHGTKLTSWHGNVYHSIAQRWIRFK